jgi:hypothetical protein
MDGDLPYWMKVSAALATPAIAFLGACIAWAQWSTARWKLVLDLYEHRRKVYTALHGPITKVMQEGTSDQANFLAFARVIDEAQFLFGRDVKEYIDEIRKTLNQLGYARSALSNPHLPADKRNEIIEQEYVNLGKVSDFYTKVVELMVPYMLMDQKRPWSPARVSAYIGAKRRAVWKRWKAWKPWWKRKAPTAAAQPAE